MRGAFRSVRTATIVCSAALMAACEVGEGTAPDLEPRVVVHAVLDPHITPLTVQVEETRRSLAGQPNAPGGETRIPITNARVVIYGPGDDSVVVVQDGATPQGVYTVRVRSVRPPGGSVEPGVLLILPGERYRLRVQTPLGVVTGETTVPPVSGSPDRERRSFNLDRETLRLTTAPSGSIAGYLVRHDTRQFRNERYLTRLDQALILPPIVDPFATPSSPAWAFSYSRDVIRPGTTQIFTVAAVDSNYFRYYVAGFDPFGDDTRGNTLIGGVGLFGSVVLLMAKPLDLVADLDKPIEGFWEATRTTFILPLSLTLYESPLFPGSAIGPDGALPIAGRAQMLVGGPAREALASVEGTAVRLFLSDPTGASGTLSATGQLGVGTLVLTESRTGERVSYRRR